MRRQIAQLIRTMRSTQSAVVGSQTLKIYLISPAPPAHPIQPYPPAPIPPTPPGSSDYATAAPVTKDPSNFTLRAHLYRLQTQTLSSQTST
ncbi:hypothetical protein FIBSPDRAFT_477872 [Athelia psychrophila]|uniref:Uncharacterized protein n=1 Tax=Athelia psychrophila TaxID=1759441 RepID=A0A166V9W7_9AGAM|nr:hypothetical protein FIBSPDRAFT_477872 [Fibularhizoctonia sp. CBS 109695]